MTRNQLLDALSALSPTQLNTVVYKLAVPRAILPGPPTPPATLIIEVLYWAEQQGRLEDVVHVLAEVSALTPALDPAPAALRQAAADGGTSTALRASRAASAGRPITRNGAPPTPVYLNAEIQALSQQLEGARQRKQSLRDAGIATRDVDQEILDLRRKLREGGQLRAGDAVGDGRYLLINPVGRGGFAVVWDAFDRTEQQRVAIKVLHQHLAVDPHRRERFFRGARVMMELTHPAVVRVLDPRGEDESFCYFVMELVPGGNLREAVLGNHVAAAHRLALILQVGEALAEAHRRQLVHRDIKPANILLDEHGNAKLTDFDLVGAHDTTGGTRTGALGTVVYAAPECLDRPQDATARADVFSLGMTTIFCLAGRDLSMDTLVDRAGALAQLDCTEPVRKVLERAVEWKQERRFADAAEMVIALRDVLRSSAQSTTPSDGGVMTARSVVQAYPMPNAINPPVGQPKDADNHWAEVNSGKGTEGSVRMPDRDFHKVTDHREASYASVERERSSLFSDGVVLRIQQRPRWASASGKDHYGEWAEFIVKGVRHRMRWIPPGTFLMGSPKGEPGTDVDEGPQHEVTLTRGYWLGETPVTQALWVAVMGKNPSQFRGERPDDLERPVEQVSWDDCHRFLDLLNAEVVGLAARLPTEAEWEGACRAGTTAATWVGELSGEVKAPEMDAIAWYDDNSGRETHPVRCKAPNAYGLHDMLGNVWELCADDMREYTAAPATDPVGDVRGPNRGSRGGSWNDEASDVRAAYRFACLREDSIDTLGFRLAEGQSTPSKYAKLQRENDDPSIEKPRGRRIADRPTGDASSLSPDAVLAKIQSAYMAGLKRCYHEYLKKDASARGKVKLSLTINETGRVVMGAAHGFASEVDECIGSQMSTWWFPTPKDKDGEATDASFEISLQFVPD